MFRALKGREGKVEGKGRGGVGTEESLEDRVEVDKGAGIEIEMGEGPGVGSISFREQIEC